MASSWFGRHAGVIAFLTLAIAVAYSFWVYGNTLHQIKRTNQHLKVVVLDNRRAIIENDATLTKLCDAALALAGFWVGVRRSTAKALRDPTLSHASRIADLEFVRELTVGIKKARKLGTCV